MRSTAADIRHYGTPLERWVSKSSNSHFLSYKYILQLLSSGRALSAYRVIIQRTQDKQLYLKQGMWYKSQEPRAGAHRAFFAHRQTRAFIYDRQKGLSQSAV